MLLNLKASTWEKLQALARSKNKSAASYVAKIVDEYVDENVKTEYKIKEENQTNA
ncbi:hypothetical protein GECvBMG_gp129 [Salmonella phage GEC_vB_MG]|uniref:Uncharacterized protein 117 n=2 Tax=Seunavirus TaxID=1914851 RepID=G3BLY2_9CAUD|nr:hypothetical protein PVP-SE1_gp116 [Salmonella phage PVPSE1]YP_009149006.1 hypothetical protein ACQ19_gp210 [Salmonella phage SSE121]QPI14673.1 hypothetical protein GECvBMG_gp129 [Salmonella phage GEC_vB_MG]WNT48153.1 hypothetical protein SPLA5a_PHROGS00070 [Salmonella phage SPLA5a]ADP02512.1 hypothetical protein [Salmonella phage PVPSE1]AFU63851.1 hypothetical protein [Salmonella phage SSE121]